MRKLPAIALTLLLITGALSGCAKEKEQDPAVARIGDEVILKSELDAKSATSDKMFDSLTGLSEEELAGKKRAAREAILEELISERILLAKAAELGIAETPEMRRAAELGWQSTVQAMTDYVLASYPTLEGKELDETVASMLRVQGLEETSAIENSIRAATRNALLEQVKESAPAPDEAQLKAAYDALLEEQTQAFSVNPASYEAALLSGDIILYAPEPCRVVASVYFRFDDDVIGLLKQLESVGSTQTLEEMRSDQRLLMDEQVAAALARLENGEDFSTIQEEWQNGGTATNYITPGSTRFADGVTEAVWSLENEGEWTEPFELEYGYQVYCWMDTLEDGAVPLEAVREQLFERLEAELRAAAVEEARALWRSEAEVEIISENIM